MNKLMFSRRQFMIGTGILAGTTLIEVTAQPPTKVIPIRRRCPGLIRREFSKLTTAQVDSLKKGISVMMSRPATDPTSWIYQANIHGTIDTPVKPLWNQCQHGTLHFFTWHRMYLYYFERILRKASGDPNLTLPFWNYSDPATQMMPLAFRSPANATNPLYVSARSAGINSGGLLPASAVDFSNAFSKIPFSGGGAFSPTIEGTPHGAVHVSIGGWMGSVPTAGRDPIFWLHHCNIDRLWNRWLDLGGGRANPTGNAAWMSQTYNFFDENGVQVTLSVKDILNNQKQLGYCYSDDKFPFIWPPFDPILDPVLSFAASVPQKQVAKSQNLSGQLSSKPYSVTINLDAESKAEINRVLSSKEKVPQQLTLNIEEIELDKVPDGYYEVYLNLPANVTKPNHRSAYYAGNLHFFGFGDHAGHGGQPKPSFKLAINDVIRKLRQAKLWNDDKVTVTFVEQTVKTPGIQTVANTEVKAKFARISLTVE